MSVVLRVEKKGNGTIEIALADIGLLELSNFLGGTLIMPDLNVCGSAILRCLGMESQ